MDDADLFKQIERLIAAARNTERSGSASVKGVKAQVCDFLRAFAGPRSSFFDAAQSLSAAPHVEADSLVAILQNFYDYTKAGLRSAVSPSRKAQLDVVSDFLEQARRLLETKGVHPAAPIVLIGATLEEFLRTWVETAGLTLGQRKPSLDSYAQTLLSAEVISKQDMKDITSWAGLRNHAAHGEWSEVADKQRAAIMLEGVNLFMRKYGA